MPSFMLKIEGLQPKQTFVGRPTFRLLRCLF
jgi:hypothetical protein